MLVNILKDGVDTMDKLIPVFEKSLFDSNLTDLAKDSVEFGIDSVLDDGILKDIPIVSTVVGVAKTAQNIYDRNLLRQTITFIVEFNSGKIDPEKLQKYRQKINRDPKYAEKELSRVLINLNGNIDLKKSKILAKFYQAYIEEKINWDQFCELSDVVSRIFIADLQLLYKIFGHEVSNTTQCEEYQVDRLVALGLLKTSGRISEEENASGGATLNITNDRNLDCSNLGSTFCYFAK